MGLNMYLPTDLEIQRQENRAAERAVWSAYCTIACGITTVVLGLVGMLVAASVQGDSSAGHPGDERNHPLRFACLVATGFAILLVGWIFRALAMSRWHRRWPHAAPGAPPVRTLAWEEMGETSMDRPNRGWWKVDTTDHCACCREPATRRHSELHWFDDPSEESLAVAPLQLQVLAPFILLASKLRRRKLQAPAGWAASLSASRPAGAVSRSSRCRRPGRRC